jgi:tRNA:m4X modification enzyme
MSLRKAIDDEEGQSTFLLLDRKNVRNKVDQSLQGFSEKPPVVQRVVIDIKDLDLSKVECILRRDDTRKKVVVLSKHLCGSATDITLKCLMNYVQAEKALGNR